MLKLTPIKRRKSGGGGSDSDDVLAQAMGVESLSPPRYSYVPETKYTIEYTEKELKEAIAGIPQVRIKDVQTQRVHARHGIPMYYIFRFKLQLVVDKLTVSSVKCVVYHIYKPSVENEFIDDILQNCNNPKDPRIVKNQYIGVGMLDSNIDIDFEQVEQRGYNKKLRGIAYDLMKQHGCAFLISDAQSPKSVHILLKYFKFFAVPKSTISILKTEFKNVQDTSIKRMLRDDAKAVQAQKPQDTRRILIMINAFNCMVGTAANMIADLT